MAEDDYAPGSRDGPRMIFTRPLFWARGDRLAVRHEVVRADLVVLVWTRPFSFRARSVNPTDATCGWQ